MIMAKLTVDPPYHFGWKIKDDPSKGKGAQGYKSDGTWQEVDLDKQTTDIILYKGDKPIGWWKVLK